MGILGLDLELEQLIKTYCVDKNLNFDLLLQLEKQWGIDRLKFVGKIDGKKEVILSVVGYPTNYSIEQTEYTQIFLS